MAHSGRFSERMATRSPGRKSQLEQAEAQVLNPVGQVAIAQLEPLPSRLARAATGREPKRSSAPKYSSFRVRAAGCPTGRDDEPLAGAGNEPPLVRMERTSTMAVSG